MGIFDDKFESTVVMLGHKPYSIVKFKEPIDVSEQDNLPEGSVTITHFIRGFEVELMLLMLSDDSFTFVHQVAPEIGLVVPLRDDEIMKLATMVVQEAELQGDYT
jgi:hypothetical protein